MKELAPRPPPRKWGYVLWPVLLVLLAIAAYLYYPILVEDIQQIESAFWFWLPRLIIVALVLVVAKLIVSTLRYSTRNILATDRKMTIAKTTIYIIWILVIILAIGIFVEDVTAFAISAGLIGFGITLALQKPILCFVGWIWITTRTLYRVGDRIKVGDVRGDVVDVNIITTTLWEFGSEWIRADQPSGRMISIPNSAVLEEPIYNYTRDFPYVWDEVTINVAPESDLNFAISILEKVADEIIGNENMANLIEQYEKVLRQTPIKIHLSRKPAIHVVSGESWIDLTVRYLVDIGKMRRTKTRFYKRILEEFKKHPDKLPPSFRRLQSQQIDDQGRPIKLSKK